MKRLWPVLFLTLMAFGLRVYDLDGQSMWSDEGLTVYRAGQSVATILANVIVVDGLATTDTNPPLYFLLLHGWRRLVGESVFALRLVGVFAGALSVPLLYKLGETAFNRRVGLAAALLLALSPFHVWQSQEMRNYGLLLLLNLASVYGLFRFLLSTGARPWRWLLLWAAAGLAAIYTHYFGFFIFAFGVAALTVVALNRRRRWRWAAVLLTGLASLPILPVALERFQAGQQVDFVFVPPHHLLSHALSAYSVGIAPGVVQPWERIAPALLLVLIGLAGGLWRRSCRRPVALVAGYQIIPLAILVFLSLFNPLYNGPRHLLIGLPPFLLLAALGGALVYQRYRWLAGLLFAGLLLSQAHWLHVQFTAPDLIKDDVRGAAQYLSHVVQPGDALLLHDSLIGFTFDHYYDGPVPWQPLPRYPQLDEAAALQELQGIGQEARRVWFVREPNPRTGFGRQVVPEWMAAHWPRLESRRFPSLWLSVAVELYAPDPLPAALPPPAVSLDFSWDDLQLRGWRQPDESAAAGHFWQPTFYWSAEAGAAAEYGFSLRLADQQGQIWASLDRALWPEFGPADWPPQQLVAHDLLLPLPVGLPAGDYQLWLRLVDGDGAPLAEAGGEVDLLLLPDLTVTRPAQPNPLLLSPLTERPAIPMGRILPEIELVHYAVSEGDYRPGHTAIVDLLWRVRRAPTQDYRLRLELVDGNGVVIGETIAAPTRADYPPTQWQPGEWIRGRAVLTVPALAEDGRHTVRMSLLTPDRERPLWSYWPAGRRSVDLATVWVSAWPMTTTAPPVAYPITAQFGDPPLAALRGYNVETGQIAAGEQATFNLVWQAETTGLPRSYYVFLHLADQDENIIAQTDGSPVNGLRPTIGWRAGEVLVDSHTLSLPSAVPPGHYRLWLGLYDPVSGERLPAIVDSRLQPDGRLLLQEVRLP